MQIDENTDMAIIRFDLNMESEGTRTSFEATAKPHSIEYSMKLATAIGDIVDLLPRPLSILAQAAVYYSDISNLDCDGEDGDVTDKFISAAFDLMQFYGEHDAEVRELTASRQRTSESE